MELLLNNNEETLNLLREFGFLPSRTQPVSKDLAKYIDLRGMRWRYAVEEPRDFRWIDLTQETEEDIRLYLEDQMESCRNFQDFLTDNIDLEINIRPRCIGHEFLVVKVCVGDKEITQVVSEIITNALGQRTLNGRGRGR